VNDILATSGCSQMTWPAAGAFPRELVTTFNTPAGIPAFSASYNQSYQSFRPSIKYGHQNHLTDQYINVCTMIMYTYSVH